MIALVLCGHDGSTLCRMTYHDQHRAHQAAAQARADQRMGRARLQILADRASEPPTTMRSDLVSRIAIQADDQPHWSDRDRDLP